MSSEPLPLFSLDELNSAEQETPSVPSRHQSVEEGASRPPDAQVPRLLLTTTEAAHALGIGRSKLYELLRDGVVPSVTIGASRRIVASDLAVVVGRLRRTYGSASALQPESD